MNKLKMLRNLILCLLIFCFKMSASFEADNLELMKSPLNRTINDFSFKFLQRLTKNDENQCNIFFSPFSISLMFSMLLHGTDGKD